MEYKTLQQIRTELRERLAMATSGEAANRNTNLLNSFINDAYYLICNNLEIANYFRRAQIELQNGEKYYDYYNDSDNEEIDSGKVLNVYYRKGENVIKLIKGITEYQRAAPENSEPYYYDTIFINKPQIEIYPSAIEGTLVIEYQSGFKYLTAETQRPIVNDRLILLHALALAKSHFRHTDAQIIMQQFSQALRDEKGKQHQNNIYSFNRVENMRGIYKDNNGNYKLG